MNCLDPVEALVPLSLNMQVAAQSSHAAPYFPEFQEWLNTFPYLLGYFPYIVSNDTDSVERVTLKRRNVAAEGAYTTKEAVVSKWLYEHKAVN